MPLDLSEPIPAGDDARRERLEEYLGEFDIEGESKQPLLGFSSFLPLPFEPSHTGPTVCKRDRRAKRFWHNAMFPVWVEGHRGV